MQIYRRWGAYAARHPRRLAAVRLCAILIFSGGCVVYLLQNWDDSDHLLGVGGAVVSVVSVLVKTFHDVVVAAPRATTEEPPEPIEATVVLVQQRRWSAEIRRRNLIYAYQQIQIRWRVAPGTTLAHMRARPVPGVGPRSARSPDDPAGELLLEGYVQDLLSLACDLPSGRLGITGGPGSGKTSALILTLMHALDRWTAQNPAPVPILLSAADWMPGELDIVQFAVEMMARDFSELRDAQRRQDLAQAITAGRIMIFLDGLDQMYLRERVRAVRALNACSSVRVVIASWQDKLYEAQFQDSTKRETIDAEALTGLIEVRLDTVDDVAAVTFLRDAGVPESQAAQIVARFAELTARGGPELRQPLYLSLFTQFNQRGDANDLLQASRTAGQVAAGLIDLIIPLAYAHAVPSPAAAGSSEQPRWTASQATKWFRLIARQMSPDSGGLPGDRHEPNDLAWSQISEWVPVWLPRLVYGSYIGLITAGGSWLALAGATVQELPLHGLPWWAPLIWGIVGGSAYVVALILDQRLTREPVVGVAIGVGGGTALGMMIGLLFTLAQVAPKHRIPVSTTLAGLGVGLAVAMSTSLVLVWLGLKNPATRERRRWPSSLRFGQPSWTVAILLALLAMIFLRAFTDRTLSNWAMVGACFGLAVMGQAMISGQAGGEATASARASIRADVKAWSGIGFVLGLIGTVLFGAAFDTRVVYLPLWFLLYFSIALFSSHTSGYLLAVTYLWLTRQFPRTPLRFLENARDRDVMRARGWRYEFKHLLLLFSLNGVVIDTAAPAGAPTGETIDLRSDAPSAEADPRKP